MISLSRLDHFEIGRQFFLSRARRISPQVVDTAGSDANLLVGAASYMASAVSNQSMSGAADLFLDSCNDEALDRYVFDRYQMIRKGAAAALGTVQFSRVSAAAGGGTIPTGTKLITLTGVEYTTLTPATFAPGGLTAEADVRAAQAGKNFQVGKNAIRGFGDASQIFDPTIQLTNEEACAGGEDVEVDDQLKSRARDFWRAARRGTLGAIAFGALSVPGVTSAMAVDEIGAFGQPVRIVRLFISDSSGVASRALATKVSQQLEEYRAGGIYVVIDLSQPQIVEVLLKLAFLARVDSVTLTSQIRSAVVNFVNSIGVGLPLQLGDLYAVLSRYKNQGLIVQVPGTIVSPIADLYPDAQRTLRTTLSSVMTVV